MKKVYIVYGSWVGYAGSLVYTFGAYAIEEEAEKRCREVSIAQLKECSNYWVDTITINEDVSYLIQ